MHEPGPAEDYPPDTQDNAALQLYNYDVSAHADGFAAWTTRYGCGL